MSKTLKLNKEAIAIKIDFENKKIICCDSMNGKIVESTLTTVNDELYSQISNFFKLDEDELLELGLKKDIEKISMKI